jgi:exopolysaccharide biosynthesis polyprenyl glycosylphosphotransferase
LANTEGRPSGLAVQSAAPRPPKAAPDGERLTVPLGLAERMSGVTVLLVVADVLAATAAGLLFSVPAFGIIGLAALLVICRSNARVYRRRLRLSYADDFPRSAASAAVAFGLAVGIFLVLNDTGPKDDDIVYVMVAFVVLSELQRVVVFAVCVLGRRRFGRGARTLVLGTDDAGVDLARQMVEHPEFGLRPVGIAELTPTEPPSRPLAVPFLTGDLASLIITHRIGTVVLAMPGAVPAQTRDAAITANRLGCSILMLPRMPELYRDSPDVERLYGYPLVRLYSDPTRRVSWWAKRALDRLAAGLALVLLSPVIAACALAVYLESGRPIIFSQQRVSVDGRLFTLLKFRSMTPRDDHESQSRWSIAGDRRVGPVGRLLRSTSLDELPQLWNIVRGDMSIVGPRPERPGFVELFSARHEGYGARHRVPAGLTGLAQVNGLRGDTSIADRARFDNYYIANWSLWLDATIVVKTLREIVRRGTR